jgi:hypothetical protein
MPTIHHPPFENAGSLLTYKDELGNDCCVGYLIYFEGRGVYDSHFGKVDVTPENAKLHNAALDKALVEGLDKCPVGSGGDFYYDPRNLSVVTWAGSAVAFGYKISGGRRRTIEFVRNGMAFSGVLRSGTTCFFAKRIS